MPRNLPFHLRLMAEGISKWVRVLHLCHLLTTGYELGQSQSADPGPHCQVFQLISFLPFCSRSCLVLDTGSHYTALAVLELRRPGWSQTHSALPAI